MVNKLHPSHPFVQKAQIWNRPVLTFDDFRMSGLFIHRLVGRIAGLSHGERDRYFHVHGLQPKVHSMAFLRKLWILQLLPGYLDSIFLPHSKTDQEPGNLSAYFNRL